MAATPGKSSIPAPCLDERIRLKDGRTLCYAEFGDPEGYPVIYFHGFPGSRLDPWPHHPIFSRQAIRIICPDRPGSGNSTPRPERQLIDYPPDILELANHLELGKFGLLGVSGGGPYAIVCAREIPPEKLGVVGLLAPATPWRIDGQGPEG